MITTKQKITIIIFTVDPIIIANFSFFSEFSFLSVVMAVALEWETMHIDEWQLPQM